LNPILFFPGTEHGMIQGNKACSIGPAQGEHPEPVEEPAAAMVMDPGKKLDAPGTIPVINGCVHYEHLLSRLIRQRFEEGFITIWTRNPYKRRQLLRGEDRSR
jgi:hypothetical protein